MFAVDLKTLIFSTSASLAPAAHMDPLSHLLAIDSDIVA